MKKILLASFVLLAACVGPNEDTTSPAISSEKAESETAAKAGCDNVRGVNDPENGGRIYYTKSHKLFKFIKIDPKHGDKRFCTVEEARRAGFRTEAPAHFKDSTYNYINCLRNESDEGSCHKYASGIFQSLKIYGKACGSPSKADLANAIESYANKTPNGMEVSKYHGTASAILNRYGCR